MLLGLDLIKNPSATELDYAKEIFKGLARDFDPKYNFNGDFEFNIKCDDQNQIFNITINNSELRINKEKSKNPYLQISMSFPTFCRMTRGFFIPPLEIMIGSIKLKHWLLDLLKFAKFSQIFGKKFESPVPGKIIHAPRWQLPEKILLVNGSARKIGATNFFLELFAQGLPKEKIEIIHVSDLRIKPCLHCFSCWTNTPGTCIQADDAEIFRNKFREADLIIFFVPLSLHTMPSVLKLAMERLCPDAYPFFIKNKQFHGTVHPLRSMKPKTFLSFLVGGFPERAGFSALERTLNDFANHSQMNNLGSIVRPGVLELLNDPRLYYVQRKIFHATTKLAEKIYQQGKVSYWLKKRIQKRGLTLNSWRDAANKFWKSFLVEKF